MVSRTYPPPSPGSRERSPPRRSRSRRNPRHRRRRLGGARSGRRRPRSPVETDPQTAPEAQPAAEQPLLAVLAGRLTREVAAAVETFYRQALNEALEEERRRLKAVHERKPGIKRLLTRPAEPNRRHTLGQVVRQAISPLVDRLVQFCWRARAVDAPRGSRAQCARSHPGSLSRTPTGGVAGEVSGGSGGRRRGRHPPPPTPLECVAMAAAPLVLGSTPGAAGGPPETGRAGALRPVAWERASHGIRPSSRR